MLKILKLLLSLLLVWPVHAQLSRFDNLQPPPHRPDEFSVSLREYGDLEGQRLHFSCPDDGSPRPLFVSRAEFRADSLFRSSESYLGAYALGRGYCFAAVQLRVNAKADEALADIVAALRFLTENADEIGYDPDRIVLAAGGFSAGPVALIGTDPQYLRAAGLDFDVLRGVILLEPDGLDVEGRAAQDRRLQSIYFPDYYGEDRATWSRYSATEHLAPPNAPDFFLLGRDGRITYAAIAQDFARRLDDAGVRNEYHQIARLRELGSEERISDDPEDPTNAFGAFLDRAAGR